jgi:hypothetical protein
MYPTQYEEENEIPIEITSNKGDEMDPDAMEQT